MKSTRVAWAVACILSALAAVTLVVAILVSATKSTEIREDQVSNTQTLNNTSRTLEILLDCTDPKGDCYRRGQDSQESAIEDITRISIYAAACADKPREQTTQEIQDCILAELDAENRKP